MYNFKKPPIMKQKFIELVVISCLITSSYSQSESENLFYMVDTPESYASFMANINQISIVCPQTFLVSKEGVVTGSLDIRVLRLAKENKVKVMPLLMNKGFDQELLHKLVSNPSARKRSIEMMLEYAKIYDLDGWQFDLEGLHISDKQNFSLYFQETAQALHQEGLILSAAIVHMNENVGGLSAYQRFLFENWRAGYAIKELSDIGDFLSIMTYDQHTRRTPPGPVAGIEWVEEVIKYVLAEGVPPEKLSLGIPNYSVHWFADYSDEKGGFSNGRQIGYNTVQHLLGQNESSLIWNKTAACNYSIWVKGGVSEYVFVEDGESLKPKLQILKKYKLRGISVWVLGKEAPDFWQVLKESTVKK